MPNDILQTACEYAWTYPVLNIGERTLRNCCRTPQEKISLENLNLGTDLFKKFIPIRSIKYDLLRGIKNNNCSTCWDTEAVGGTSSRTGFERFAKFINATKWLNITLEETKAKLLNLSDDDINELVNWEHPKKVEIMLSTICDLKCVYCNDTFSSQWYSEKVKYKEIPIKQANTNVEEYENIWWSWFESVACETVVDISFVGGEPLLDVKLYQYINRILNIRQEKNITSNLVISIVTNFNTPKKYLNEFLKLLQRISNTKNVHLSVCISFESLEKQNSFIRTGSKWELFQDNINEMMIFLKNNKIYKSITIHALPAFCSLSVSNMLPFVSYVVSLMEKHSRLMLISKTHVSHPLWSSPFILTPDYITYIDETIEYLKNLKIQNLDHVQLPYFNTWKKEFIQYLDSIKTGIVNVNTNLNSSEINELRKDFANNIDKIVARNTLDFNSTFPEMIDFYNLCKEL